MPQARDEAGNVWEIDAQGNAVRLLQPAGQQMPADPTFQYQQPKAQAEVQGAQLRNDGQVIDNSIDRETYNAVVRKAEADARKAEADAKKAATPEGATPPDPMKLAQFRALQGQIDRVQELYDAGPGTTSGLRGVVDYLPSDANAAFDSAAAGLGEVGLAAFRVPGVGSQSDTELRQFVAANTPSASDRDAAIREKLGNLKRRLAATQEQLGIAPQSPQAALPNAMTDPRLVSGAQIGAAGAGATTQSVPYPAGGQQEHAALLQQLMQQGGGRGIDPQAYAQGRAALDQKYQVQGDPTSYLEWANGVNQYLEQGGASIPMDIAPANEELGGFDQLRNDVALNPLVSGGIGFADSVGMGGVTALAGDKMAALGEANPVSTTIGQIGGAIGATGAIGKLGAAGASRIAPGLLGGGSRGQFGRNVATDAVYGAGYGGVTEGDPLTGAALAGVGSVGGQAVGKGLGTAFGGVDLSRAAQALQAKGVPLTGGRMMGDFASRVEDKMASVPFVGDMIRNRQSEGFEAFNRAAFRDAGEPIGFQPSAIGGEGVDQFGKAVSSAYDDATAGVSGPFDGQFAQEFESVVGGAQSLPQDVRRGFGEILNARVQPMMDAGQIDGNSYQQAMRALKASRNKPPQRFEGYEQDYRDAVTGTMDALTGQMQRSGGQPVIDGLARANSANKGFKILEDAALDRAKIGTQTGESEVFLPSQLIAAARKSEKKYGPSPLKQLGKDGQAVLPSTVPNSGTADRGMQAAMGIAGLGALGGGEAYATGDASTTAKLAAAIALLTVGGTKTGQKALGKVLNTRPETAKRIGRQINQRKGLFGSAAVPLVLNPQF